MKLGEKMIKEFKEFINRGNVMDLAIGVIVGGAFNTIVTSLVNDIIMPIIGLIIGGVDFSGLTITFRNASINYGLFLQNIINFLLIAFSLFLVIRAMNRIDELKHKNEKIEKVEKKDENILLLKEIRDTLKEKKKTK